MHAIVELNLALILFLPWYVLLAWLFWHMRARGKSTSTRLAALAFLVGSLAAAGIAGAWAFGHADPSAGAIWKQVLACVVGYGTFLAVLTLGFAVLRSPTVARQHPA